MPRQRHTRCAVGKRARCHNRYPSCFSGLRALFAARLPRLSASAMCCASLPRIFRGLRWCGKLLFLLPDGAVYRLHIPLQAIDFLHRAIEVSPVALFPRRSIAFASGLNGGSAPAPSFPPIRVSPRSRAFSRCCSLVQIAVAPALGLHFETGLFKFPRSALGPFLMPLRKVFSRSSHVKTRSPNPSLLHLPHARQNMHMEIPVVAVAVGPVDVRLGRNTFAQRTARA